MSISKEDERFLRRTISLARRGIQKVSPNPAVGAVVVKSGTIIAEGWHRKAGLDHAELAALRKAGEAARGATLYINIEPCCHWGRTPPCTDAIIAAGIRRVVVCGLDPNPKVNGGGFKALAAAGIKVDSGALTGRAEHLNEIYYHFMRTGRPFIHVKAGLSLDGKLATSTGESQWITGEKARRYAHRLRQRYDAILVGINTVLVDDPRLDVRIKGGGSIKRIVLDTRLRIPLEATVLNSSDGGEVIVAASRSADPDRIKKLKNKGAVILYCNERDGKLDVHELIGQLAQFNVTSLIIEGGGEIIASFLESGLATKLTFVYAPIVIGGRNSIPSVSGGDIKHLTDAYKLRDLRCFRLGPDIAIEGYFES